MKKFAEISHSRTRVVTGEVMGNHERGERGIVSAEAGKLFLPLRYRVDFSRECATLKFSERYE